MFLHFGKKFVILFQLYGNITWTFCMHPLITTVFCSLYVRWNSWLTVLFTVLMGYSFISVNNAFRCSISCCNSIAVEQTVLDRLTKFLSFSIFHYIGAYELQLSYKSVLVAFLWIHVSIWFAAVLLTSISRNAICLFFSNSKVSWIFAWYEFSFVKIKSTFSGLA